MKLDIKNILGMTVIKYNIKDIIKFFLIILAPNILRQVLYYITFLKTNSIDFIVSFETIQIYNIFPFLGILEEVIIGIIFTFFWFKFIRLRFFAYGWISDALIDYISVLSWVLIGFTPLQLLGLNNIIRFFIREVVLSYLILGLLLYKYRIKIYKLVLLYIIVGILTLFIVIIG